MPRKRKAFFGPEPDLSGEKIAQAMHKFASMLSHKRPALNVHSVNNRNNYIDIKNA